MEETDELGELKLELLHKKLAEGEADLAAGRKIVITTDEELSALFARL